ncbi:RING finger protein 10 [Drosophila willistoni]|uniref:RING finger protein 10 n=1 Tax=Drosophila willistoni TaxID=7260 RepID=UPI001F075FD5|nr:RING finger protein 10 [Drosophila willistoni]
MENNNSKKQQQSHHNVRSSKSSASDLHTNNNKYPTRSSRRREQLPTPRNDQQQQQQPRKQAQQQQQQQQQQAAKLRPNVDKRPRARGGCSNAQYGSGAAGGGQSMATSENGSYGGAGLAVFQGGGYSRSGDFDYELNSVYAHGSKKQNLNHLLNFHCVRDTPDYGSAGARGGGAIMRKPRYNKEQFLQANFQFVISSNGCKGAQVMGSPDTLIDWAYIEQINIQTTEEPQCPICLYPPVAAKLTRCGHAYCWPCLLHYLSLSDKTWRKCPICYDAIHAADLKSCHIEQQNAMNVGDRITFQLMRRRKGSMYIERFGINATGGAAGTERFPLMSSHDEAAKHYTKFLIAKRADVKSIIERERRELMSESDISCPEDIFIQQALVMLNERSEKLVANDNHDVEDLEEQTTLVNEGDTKVDTDEVASVSSGEASTSSSSAANTFGNGNNTIKYYYFYQSNDGQHIYLHPLNVKMLQACYGSLDLAPLVIEANILQKEQHSMDEEHRRKFTCLGHLPLTCQFSVVEVELQQPIVSGGILKLFEKDLHNRHKERQRREREERKREQQINELNDRQMGKLIASAANLNLESSHEFPTCGFEEALPMTINHASNTTPLVTPLSPSPKELWPSIGSSSSPGTSASLDFHVGAWGRSAPPPPPTVHPSASKNTAGAAGEDDMRSVGHWGLGELLVGALDQKKQHHGNANAPQASTESNTKKHKKGKAKMIPLFTTGMNRAP